MALPRQQPAFSEELERWLESDADKTLGALVDLFGAKSFAALFVVLLAVPALPLPTGGATHVFELVAMLLALQLIVNRDRVWLPRRWRAIEMDDPRRRRFLDTLMRLIRRLERRSRPRMPALFGHRLSNIGFGTLALGGSLAAFLAPPFSGLDTMPALGVVLLSMGVLLEDVLVLVVGIAVMAIGVVLEIVLWSLAVNAFRDALAQRNGTLARRA
jgi:hypothetical protein